MIELRGRDVGSPLDLTGIGKTLSGERITTEEPPPAFLQIEPARSRRNEDVMQARMLSHPGPRLSTVVATQIIRDNEDVARWIVRFNVLEECNIVRGVP